MLNMIILATHPMSWSKFIGGCRFGEFLLSLIWVCVLAEDSCSFTAGMPRCSTDGLSFSNSTSSVEFPYDLVSCLQAGISCLPLTPNKDPLRFTETLVLKGLGNLPDPTMSQNGSSPLCVSAEQLALVHRKFQVWG